MIWLLLGAEALRLLAPHQHAANATNAVYTGMQIPLENHHAGAQYTINMELAGTQVRVIPDTGSFSLLVTSTRCEGCPQQAFNHEDAPTADYASADTTDSVSFGSGVVQIQLSHMDIELGDLDADKAAVWEITHSDASMTSVWEKASFEGIFGFGWKDHDRNQTTVLESLGVTQFVFCLGSWRQDGILHLGTVLPDHPKVFAPVIGENHWGIALSEITATRSGIVVPPLCSGTPCGALIDSGTTQVLLPPEHVATVRLMIGPIHPHCENWNELPDLVFKLGDHDMRLTKNAYAKRVDLGGIPRVIPGPELTYEKTDPKSFCWLSLGSAVMRSDHGPTWIFGMPFFREHAVAFDREKKEIGFGEPCGPPPEPPRKTMTERLCEDGKLVDEDGNVIEDCAAFAARALLSSPNASNRSNAVGKPGARPQHVDLRSPGLEDIKF
jgi:hypothetical protein